MGNVAVRHLGAEEFISFTTFRRNGEPVPTPVWVVPLRDGERVGFYTTMGTGKTKRLRHTSRVTVQPCGRTGTLKPGTEPVEGTAEMVQGGADFDEVRAAVRAKYGWQTRVFRLVGKLMMRGKGRTYGDTVVLVTPGVLPG
ncbi:F420-dependent oxidoreductase [Serinicoccus sp. CUA-874]|uniref:PPOX class F420-dependent oxidoreductase n=1 Tax=Serinicoccus sp. CUA-874 TaxID=1517939 RepID=UPI00095BDABD|nr:PPOX class F420-dependent oxidoreductase [Serinicoccus sp. CUA-874]OLT16650.1 F420-dependent oxidoreductase [Serinicoccus sp. CUA-874]